MIESPYLEEVIKEGVAQLLPKRLEEAVKKAMAEELPKAMAEALRRFITDALTVRFGDVPTDRLAPLATLTDRARLEQLHRLAVACPSLEAFLGQLPGARP